MEGKLSLAKEDLCRGASIQKLHPCLGIISIRHFDYTVAIKHGIVTSPITIRHYFSNEVVGKTINTALSLHPFVLVLNNIDSKHSLSKLASALHQVSKYGSTSAASGEVHYLIR